MFSQKRRQFSLLLHRYLGIVAGLLFIIVGLTGSFLVFSEDIDRSLNPHLLQVQPQSQQISPGKVVEIASDAFGDLKPHRITVPRSPEQAYTVMMISSQDDFTDVYIDPYRGEILGVRPWKKSVGGFLIDLHVYLASGDRGMQIVGIVGIAMIVTGITGLLLWKGWRNWRQAFRIRWQSRRSLLTYDLHKVAGALGVIWLILIAVTGVTMIYWTPFENTVYWLTGERKPLEITASSTGNGTPMAIDVLLEKAHFAFPEAQLYKFYPVKESGELFRVWSLFPDENAFNQDLHISLDPSTGAIIRVEDGRKASLATRIITAQYTLHVGHYGGLMTRWLYLLVGLAPIFLGITGLKLWQTRRWKEAQRPSRFDRIGE